MKFGFIGAGNMGGALARAAAKTLGGKNIILADQMAEKAAALAEEFGLAAEKGSKYRRALALAQK